jgi:predicted alpha/beta hydrolase
MTAAPTDVTVRAPDGFALAATRFRPAEPNGAAVVVASGTGIPRRFYAKVAAHFASRGFDALTFDYRGIGGSRPASLRGFAATMDQWGRLDLDGALAFAAETLRPRRLFVLGHSAGGQLVGLAPASERLDGAVFVSAQSGYWRHWRGFDRARVALVWHAALPLAARAFGRVPRWLGLGEELPKGVALQWARWCRDPAYLFGDAALDRARYARLALPILAFSLADDGAYAPQAAVAALLAAYRAAAIEHRRIDPVARGLGRIGHFGFFREPARVLWDEAADWLAQRAAA